MAVDIGKEAIDRPDTFPSGWTVFNGFIVAVKSGVLTSIDIWPVTPLTGCKIGIFYHISGSTHKCRSSVTLGAVSAGFQNISGLSLAVEAGDRIGLYYSGGTMERNTTGEDGQYYVSGDHCDEGVQAAFTLQSDDAVSLGGYISPGLEVTIQDMTDVLSTSAKAHGTITQLGGSACTQHGHCWNTTGTPTTADDKTELGAVASAPHVFESDLADLIPGETYYVRAYATDGSGTVYSETEKSFLAGEWIDEAELPFDPSYPKLYFSPIISQGVFIIDSTDNFYYYCLAGRNFAKLKSPEYTDKSPWLAYRALALSPNGRFLACVSDGGKSTQTFPNAGGRRVEIYHIPTNNWIHSSVLPDIHVFGYYGNGWARSVVWKDDNTLWVWAIEGSGSASNCAAKCLEYNIWTDVFTVLSGYLMLAKPSSYSPNFGWSAAIKTDGTRVYTNGAYYIVATDTYAFGGGGGYLHTADRHRLWAIYGDGKHGYYNVDDESLIQGQYVVNVDRDVGYDESCGLAEDLSLIIEHSRLLAPQMMSSGPAAGLDLPAVETNLMTDLKKTTATGNGYLREPGIPACTQHGHCWSTTANPTTANDKTELGAKSAPGYFTSSLTGLDPNTTYHCRAYATNTEGTAYGIDVEFLTEIAGTANVTTQECTDIQSESATGNGNLVAIGDSAVTEHGHVWAQVPNPTTANFKTTLGARGVGVFESSMTSLTPGRAYYVRAYATNTEGTAYGDNVILECAEGDIPTITTQACSAIAPESATGHGNITSFGDDTPSQHGHCWSTSQYPTLADNKTQKGVPYAPGAFTSSITGLLPDTRYYIRAYATNVYGTAYGNQVSIFTYPGGALINPANPVAVDWADDGVFVDISQDVMEQYIEWGKDRELNEATPSLLALTLDNYDHKYSPPNAASPYNTGANSVRAGHRITVSFGYPFDDFEDVDGVNIVNHVVPKDSQFAWTEESGTFSIYSNKLRETAGSGGIAVIDFGEPDAHIQVDFTKGANNDCIIVFRYSDTSNYLYVKTDGTNIQVRKVDTGDDTLVESELLAWANGVTKTVKVILHGAYIYLVVEGSLVISTSSTHNQAETEHGVGGPIISTNARYEDFGGIYSLFYGTIDRIIPYPNKEKQTALIEASDDLKILERHKLYRRAYSYTGYPGGMRAFIQEVYKNTANVSQLGEIMDIGESIATSPYKSWWGISGLRVCRNVEREENGFFYQDQDSFWNFEAKGHRAAAPHATARCTFYQDYETNKLAFTGLKWESGEEDVFNMISVHVEKSQRDPGNLPVGGQYVWRCAEADVLDGGIGTSLLEIPATDSVIIYFESKDFDCLEDLITPAVASAVYRIEGKITGGPFLLAEVVTGSVSGHTGRVLEQAGGYIVLGDCTGAFDAADIWVGATSGATIAIGFKIEGTIANGPFLFGEGITTDVSGDTGIVREVGQDFVLLESCSGVFNAGDTVTGTKSTATLNGTVTITVVGSKALISDYQANAAANGGGDDKTGNLTVVLSYPVYNSYGKGGKLTLTNDDTSPIYVTRLLVRGDAYNIQDKGSVYVEDATSKTTYGEHSYDVKAEILTSLAEAKVLADDVKTKEIAPRAKVEITLVNANKEMLTKILSLKLSDRITVNYSDMGIDEPFFINKIIYNITEGGLNVEAVLKLEEVS